MLGAIVAAIHEAGRPVCLAELTADLGIEASALEGMLETLVERGRLRTIRADPGGCGTCRVRSGCFIMRDAVATTWTLPAPPAQPALPDAVGAR